MLSVGDFVFPPRWKKLSARPLKSASVMAARAMKGTNLMAA
jgi:hypothetical protein